MKEKDLHTLTLDKSCEYAMKKCEEEDREPEEDAVLLADCYTDGYNACWSDLARPRIVEQDETKMKKDLANEYAAIAYNALAELVQNGNINPISQKAEFKKTMKVLNEFYNCPL